jgi:hypothetical protein
MMRPVTEPQARAATGVLRDALAGRSLKVAGVSDAQWAVIRTSAAEGGEAIDARRSTGDAQAVKALAWAVRAVVAATPPEFVM